MAVSHAGAITGIDIIAYSVRDGERAKAFYRDVLGLPVGADYGPQGGEFNLSDGTTFGVWQVTDESFEPSSGVMFAVDDIRSAVETYRSRGVEFEADGSIEETAVCFMAFAKDTEGNKFILHQRKAH